MEFEYLHTLLLNEESSFMAEPSLSPSIKWKDVAIVIFGYIQHSTICLC